MSLTQPVSTHSTDTESNAGSEPSPAELLTLLDDEHTRTILETIQTERKPARALANECGVSRPTVYRRLNDLDDAGLVESRVALDADGHHRTVFKSRLQSVSVEIADHGLSVTVERDGTVGSPGPRESHRSGTRGRLD